MSNLSNILAIARREFTVRIRTRSYRIGSAALILGVLAFAFLPVIGRVLEGGGQSKPIALYVTANDLPGDPAARVAEMLNAAAPATGGTGTYVVTTVADLDAARDGVASGTYSGVLSIARSAVGELDFTYYTSDALSARASLTAALVHQSVQSMAVGDRLARLGIAPTQQATLFTPAPFSVEPADPDRAGPSAENYLLGFGLTILIFMMVVLYGSWIAMSVVEEKSSRVVEVVLNAATPFQLLSGKVLGVGGLALVQYIGVLLAGGVAFVLQQPIAGMLFGEAGASIGLPAGLNAWVLVLLVVYGVLGFLLYSVLFAAAASLVSRQEDVNQSVMPMMLVATAGYMVAVYAGTGLLDGRAAWITVIAQFPFFSPFMMLSRVTAGTSGPAEVMLSIVLLAVTIAGALWLAARIYSAGVLLYGQRPSLRRVWRVIRTGA